MSLTAQFDDGENAVDEKKTQMTGTNNSDWLGTSCNEKFSNHNLATRSNKHCIAIISSCILSNAFLFSVMIESPGLKKVSFQEIKVST